MSIINSIECDGPRTKRAHPSVAHRCEAYIVNCGDGNRYVEVNSYGSADREAPGQASQQMQFTEQAARALRKLIDEAFPE